MGLRFMGKKIFLVKNFKWRARQKTSFGGRKCSQRSLAKNQVWRQIKYFGVWFVERDVGIKIRVANTGSSIRQVYDLKDWTYCDGYPLHSGRFSLVVNLDVFPTKTLLSCPIHLRNIVANGKLSIQLSQLKTNNEVKHLNSIIVAVLSKISHDSPDKCYRYVFSVQQIKNSTFQRSINITIFDFLFFN